MCEVSYQEQTIFNEILKLGWESWWLSYFALVNKLECWDNSGSSVVSLCADSRSRVPFLLSCWTNPGHGRVKNVSPDGHDCFGPWVSHTHTQTDKLNTHLNTNLICVVSAHQAQSKFLTFYQRESWPPVASTRVELLSAGLQLWSVEPWKREIPQKCDALCTRETEFLFLCVGEPVWGFAGDRIWGWGGPVTGAFQPSEASPGLWAQSQRRSKAAPQAGL